MAQMTGTQILELARIFAQDQGASPAVSDPDALILLNDCLLKWASDVDVRVTTVSALLSQFTATTPVQIISDTQVPIEDILSLHQSPSTAITYPLAPAVKRYAPEEVWAMHGLTGSNAAESATKGTLIEAWAAERDTNNDDKWTVYLYPAPTTHFHATLRATMRPTLAALTDTPNISHRGARIVARFLGWEMARQQKQNDQGWLDSILSPIPGNVMGKWFGQARYANTYQGGPNDYGVIGR